MRSSSSKDRFSSSPGGRPTLPPLIRFLTIGFVALTMFSIGMKTSWGEMARVFRYRSFLVRVSIANLFVVPLFALAIGAALHISESGRIGLVLLAVMPGATLGLQFTAATRESRSAAAVLTFLFCLFAIFAAPWYAECLMPSERFEIPLARFVLALFVYLALPLTAGLTLKRMPAGRNAMFKKSVDLFAMLSFLALFIATLEAKSSAIRKLAGTDILALVALLAGSILIGWLFGRSYEEKRFLAAITSLRNVAVALAVAQASFPGRNIDLFIIAYSALMLPPNAVMLFTHKWTRRKRTTAS